MMKNSTAILFFVTILLTGCVTSRVTTAWKNDMPSDFPYQKIMVAAIMKEDNDSLRIVVETQVAAKLKKLGYHAVSAAGEYGRYGLEALSQEATYLSLCDNGVDAVLTVALVPDSVAADLKQGGAKKYSALYYYDHIWDYHKAGSIKGAARLKWEMILFDVSQLQPQFVLESRPLPARQAKAKVIVMAEQALQKLIREKMILNTDTNHRKPF